MTADNQEKETADMDRPSEAPIRSNEAQTTSRGEHSTPSDSDNDLVKDVQEKEDQIDEAADEQVNDDGRYVLHHTKSSATSISAFSAVSSAPPTPPARAWYQKLNPLRWSPPPSPPDERRVSKEYHAGFMSKLTFQWMTSLMSTGYKRPLELNDVWLVNPDRSSDVMAGKFEAAFQKCVERGDRYPVLWALNETFFFDFWLAGCCQLLSSILQVMSPFTLRYLIAFATDAYDAAANGTPAPNIGKGLGLVFGVTIMQIFQSLATNHYIYRGFVTGGQIRAVLISQIFEKSMRISGRAKAGGKAVDENEPENVTADNGDWKLKYLFTKGNGPQMTPDAAKGISGDGTGWGNGKVVNIMGVDTYRIDQACGMFHLIWTGPVMILITLVVLVINLSYSALAGFALLVIGIPALTEAVKFLFARRRAINKITDQRVSLTQEILQSVRFVKYFGWEESFIKRIGDIRKKEIRSIQTLLAIRNGVNAVSMALPIFASMLSFITYSSTSHGLVPATVFSSLALFNSLRLPLNLLPLVIGQAVDAWSSMNRIQEFLLAEDRTADATWKEDAEEAIKVVHASFTWERTPTQGADQTKKSKKSKEPKKIKGGKEPAPDAQASDANVDSASTLVGDREPFKLLDMDFTVGRNELIAVIGSVGSGKSSLLAALAGDMRAESGEVIFGASRAFCPQYAWIQNTTVKDNILFGKEMKSSWYKKVVEACALTADLDMLPNGDLTEIGERGITISGGQKQRLNIARAIYFDADIVLMDDPLSAVDAHVGRHIFDNAINGLLKDKCRILATHQLWVLNRCDRIIWLEEGKIQAIDTFDNLMSSHAAFKQLMLSTAVEEEHEVEDDDDDDDDDEEKKKKKPIKKRKQKAQGLMQSEERAVSSVGWNVYAAYVRASGTILNAPLVFLLLALSQVANIITSLWLSWWTSNKFNYSTGVYVGVYAALGFVQAILIFVFSVSLTIMGTNASKSMLKKAMYRVMRAPMSFFDTTPLGRISNRFSRDVDTMDNNLTDAMRMYFLTVAMITSVFALIIAYFHFFAVALVPLFFLFLFAASYYRASARELKRFEAVLRSHVFAKFGEGLSGIACIRAYGLQDRFVRSIRESIDQMDSAYFLTFSNQRWLSTRVDVIGNLLVFTCGILVVTSRFDVGPSIAGLVLSYILSIVQMLQFTVRQLAEMENGMNSAERMHYYGTQLEEEAPLHTIDVRPSWPESGEIIFDNVEMRYRDGLPLVLKGLSLHVKGGERIGVVGRTGAGKSSIMSTLFRLVELSGGSITVDGLNISTIGLHDLRSRLAIIPQDPTLFRGTIRSNLDPFQEHTDLELWDALRKSDLVSAEPDTPADDEKATAKTGGEVQAVNKGGPTRIHLDTTVEEEGMNFSLGQRQLLALARALVRNSRIIVCDEATSSVDMETDEKIQRTMATAFKGKTLLCIAHRLKTIINYDRIIVMDQGHIAEVGTPLELWEMGEGAIFRSMCERSGIRRQDIDG